MESPAIRNLAPETPGGVASNSATGQALHLVVIVGCQRSGTTLLGQLLGAHRTALLVDEDEGAYDLLASILETEGLDRERAAPILAKADKKYKIRRTSPQGEPLESVRHLVLKLPNATAEVGALSGLPYPKSVVFSVRDVRDVVCSMNRLPHVPMLENQTARLGASPIVRERHAPALEKLRDPGVKKEVRQAIVWRIKTSFYADFAAPPLDALVVRYEDVVRDVDTTVRGLMAHVGMPDNSPSYHPKEMAGVGPGLTLRERPVDRSSVGRWRRTLSDAVEEAVWAEAEPLMLELGYRRSASSAESEDDVHCPDPAILDGPVVATGRGGSGTRLLSELLDQLGVFLGNELNTTRDSVEWADILYEMSIKLLADGVEAMGAGRWRSELVTRAKSVLAAGRWTSPRPWGFKLPECMLVLPELAAAFPRSRFVLVVRDPLDCCLRRTHMTSRTDNPIGVAALSAAYRSIGRPGSPEDDPDHIRNAIAWLFQVRNGRETARTLGGRCREVRYEDICSRPQEVADGIARFLGVAAVPVRLDIEPRRMRTWTAGDPRAEDVWAICGGLARAYGYVGRV